MPLPLGLVGPLCAVWILLLVPATAAAGTVRIVDRDGCGAPCSRYDERQTSRVIDFVGQPGEANQVFVRRVGDDLVVHDDTAPVSAGMGCAAIDDRTARCPAALVTMLVMSLGDGDDAVRVEGELGLGELGPGALLNGLYVVLLVGGPGRDALTGGPGFETLDGGPGVDRLDGGGSLDSVDFLSRTTPVTVDLLAGWSSEAGETDTLANIEGAYGGAGDDTLTGASLSGGAGEDQLTGTDGAETLQGGSGDDRIDGGGGDDTLHGDSGSDTLRGESGDDTLVGDDEAQGPDDVVYVKPYGADRLDGGSGDDFLKDYGDVRGDEMKGGSGNDQLRAGDAATRLRGGTGRDKVRGSPQADRIDGGPGADKIRARGGRDRIDARDGTRDSVDGGPGRDRVRADRRDRVR